MKSKPEKTQAQLRAALRASEQRRLEHAYGVFGEMATKHLSNNDAVNEMQRVHQAFMHLSTAIKNQHINDERYKEYRNAVGIVTGEF